MKARTAIARKAKVILQKVAFNVSHQIRHIPDFLKSEESDLVEKIIAELDLSGLAELDAIMPEIQAVAADAGMISVREAGIARSDLFNQINARAVEFSQARAAVLVTQIEETTRERLRELVTAGFTDQQTRDQLADSIMGVDNDIFGETRALLIADTETGIANGEGALNSYKEAEELGIKIKKEWLDSPGACVICQLNAAAGAIPIDEDFPSGDATTPAHPRCECTTIGVTEE